MMVSAEFLGYEPRIWGLIEIGVPKSDGKCFYRLRIGSRHQSYDRRRIRAPTEHGSQRNICDQTNAHRILASPSTAECEPYPSQTQANVLEVTSESSQRLLGVGNIPKVHVLQK